MILFESGMKDATHRLTHTVSCWYPRTVLGRRYAILYSTVSLTGAFGGLLATAIHALDGTHGLQGWQ